VGGEPGIDLPWRGGRVGGRLGPLAGQQPVQIVGAAGGVQVGGQVAQTVSGAFGVWVGARQLGQVVLEPAPLAEVAVGDPAVGLAGRIGEFPKSALLGVCELVPFGAR
jgi:hypothetical protein